MNKIEFLPGTTINTLGTVERLHFNDLFDTQYVINETCFSASEIKNEIINTKDALLNRLLFLLKENPTIAFKFLTKIMLKTKNIPLINILNSQHIELKSTLNSIGFDIENYRDYAKLKRCLQNFLFTYYTKKLD